ncbi:MAG: peptide chain release factor 1 [Saprospiraceae bacterium]
MLDKLNAIHERYVYLEEQLSDPEIFGDQDRSMKVNKEYKSLEEIIAAREEYILISGNIETAKEMLGDSEMKEMAQMELDELVPNLAELEEKIKLLLVPKDPEDEKDVIFEIRAGTGGDEACLFAGDMYKMYSKYFDDQGWKTEAVTINEGTVGGYSKLVLEVTGNEVFGKLKFESGAHRVQRVPKTESKGRLHTSAVTVVAMPKLVMEDVNINKADLKTDTFRSSGAGGQHVNKTESGVRFTHLPTGIVSESTDGRSQIKNREIALQRLYVKIYAAQREAHESKVASARKSLVGSGDRSDKIRTYNFPQNRVTDHRIGLSLNKLDKVLAGDIGEIIEALRVYENAEKLKEGAEG